MKTPIPIKLTVAAFLVAATLNTHAQNWTTVLARENAATSGLSLDPAGNIYVAGDDIYPDNSRVAIVLGSGDQGTTWGLLDQYAVAGLNYAYNRAVAFNPATGGLLAGGNLNNFLPTGAEYDALWFIREWHPDTGWVTVDDSVALANDVGQASCADIMVVPSGPHAGDVYATGGGQLGTGVGWVTRKRSTGASTFTTVDADYSGQSYGAGVFMAFHPSYGVFTVGTLNGFWTVRRSANGDLGSWQTIDTFRDRRTWHIGSAYGILVAHNGDIYVTGEAYNLNSYSYHWITRRSTDGGATWSIVDVFQSGSSPGARGITEDASGRILVCGHVYGTAGDEHWAVRRGELIAQTSKQKGKTVTTYVWNWVNLGGDPAGTGDTSNSSAVAVDPSGNTYVSGTLIDATGSKQLIVRKLPAGQ